MCFLFPLIWQKTSGGLGQKDQMIKLLKIFKIWDMFFDKQTLKQISEELKLEEMVSQICLTFNQFIIIFN